MAREAAVMARVARDLYEDARRAAGLPEDATQGQVVRYALAVAAGRDPLTEAFRDRRGRYDRHRKAIPA